MTWVTMAESGGEGKQKSTVSDFFIDFPIFTLG